MISSGNYASDIPIVVINLNRSRERLRTIAENLSDIGLEWSRFSAISPHSLSQSPLYRPKTSFLSHKLNIGELGCFLSHLACLESFISGTAEQLLVLEDDVSIDRQGLFTIRALYERLQRPDTKGWQCVNLSNAYQKKRLCIGMVGQSRLFRAWQFPLLTSALLWSRNGAKAFHSYVFESGIWGPVDNQLRYFLAASGFGLSLDPPPFDLCDMASLIRGTDVKSSALLGKFDPARLRERIPVHALASWNSLMFDIRNAKSQLFCKSC
jgi:glycosyl transferase, family 25